MADPGIDVECDGDLDPFFGLVSGRHALIEAIHHRYQTARGTLIDDNNYGINVAAWQNETATPARIFALQMALEGEALKDERIRQCAAAVTFTLATQTLTFSLSIVDDDGPFTLVLAATSLSVDILSVTHGS